MVHLPCSEVRNISVTAAGTDLVTRTEIFVRVVIEHTPPESSANTLVCVVSVYDLGVSDCVFHPMRFVVERLSREHMTVKFGNKIGRLRGSDLFLVCEDSLSTVEYEIVECVDVSKQMTVFDLSTRSLSCVVKAVSHLMVCSYSLSAILRSLIRTPHSTIDG